jgi:hypothetical protein
MTITESTPIFHPGPRQLRRTPDDWVDQPYDRFTVRPLSPTIGAVVSGVSMADAVDAELFQQLNRALLEWKVLFFRDQHLTHAEHSAFLRKVCREYRANGHISDRQASGVAKALSRLAKV